MANYKVFLNDKSNQKVKDIAEMTNSNVEDILSELIKNNLEGFFADYVILKYKNGEMKAREAWKASGLDYQEFQNRSQQLDE